MIKLLKVLKMSVHEKAIKSVIAKMEWYLSFKWNVTEYDSKYRIFLNSSHEASTWTE
jgi:hypothetical protein